MLAALALGIGLTQCCLGVLAVTGHGEGDGLHAGLPCPAAHEVLIPAILNGHDLVELTSIEAAIVHVSFL